MSTDPNRTDYRWLKCKHDGLLFWGIEGPLPWPAEEERKIEPKGEFPFLRLLEGIQRLRAAGREWQEDWGKVETFLQRGDELGEAIESGDYATTLKVLDELEALRPGTPYYAFNRSFALKAQGDLEGALAAAIEATQRGPKLEYLWMRRGELHEELEQEKEAIFCFRKALALLPNHQQALEGLARLGAMVKVTLHYPDGTHGVRYTTTKQWLEELKQNVASLSPADPQLRSLLKQFRGPKDGEMALLVVDRILQGDPPDRTALCIQRADALRRMERITEATLELEAVLAAEPHNAEALYVFAWIAFDRGRNEEGWQFINRVLALDPNHEKAIQCKFHIGPNNPEVAPAVAAWAERRESWRGYWVASITASTHGDEAGALRYAEAAYKLAPEERDALFLYANCLNNMDEGEHTAALVHPRLPAAKGDYELKYIFAGAMKKLGLKDEAIRVLRESLEEESDITVEWRQNTQHFLEELTGLLATGEIEVELHPHSQTLRRGIWVGSDEGPQAEIISPGVAAPVGKAVKMTPKPGFTGSTGSVAVFLHSQNTEREPTSLGWFRVQEIEFGAAEPPLLMVQVNRRGELEGLAKQGERRLPVTWSLYRVPSMETEGT